MSDFFHGWRRKAGCFLLVMASLLVGGWIRSMYMWDIFGDDDSVMPIFLHSSDNTFFLSRHSDWEFALCFPTWSTNAFRPVSRLIETGREEWRFRVLGVGYATLPDGQFLMLPYWLIVVPIALLSAYLLLWPGKRAERQTKASVEDK